MIERGLCPILVGREDELSSLEDALLDAGRGDGRPTPLGQSCRREESAISRRHIVSLIGGLLLMTMTACGSNASSTIGIFPLSTPTQDVTACAGGGPTKADVPAGGINTTLTGTVSITMLQRADLPKSFLDTFVNQTVTAEGKFIGIRYAVKNGANTKMQPSSINESLFLTDGKQSWDVADYTGPNPHGVSGAWSVSRGDAQPETYIGAGFDGTTWAVFDVPTTAMPTGIALRVQRTNELCLGLP